MKKYFFQKDDEICYDLNYHLNFMKKNNIKEMKIFEAKVERGTGYFFCEKLNGVGTVGESCGSKFCKAYEPRNRKSGICKYYQCVYEQIDKIKILKS